MTEMTCGVATMRLLAGDGGFMFTMPELMTAAEL